MIFLNRPVALPLSPLFSKLLTYPKNLQYQKDFMQATKCTHYNEIASYITKDGSLIRELMHPTHQGNSNQSLAEAEIPAKTRTFLHKHHKTEELYHVTQGHGTMILGEDSFPITVGDTVHIPAGTAHAVQAHDVTIKILCCCSPAYAHDDTELCD